MKRCLDQAFDSQDQLAEFKNTIRVKSDEIVEKELGKLVPRSLHRQNVDSYLRRQYDLDKTNGDVLKAILESVQHVPAGTLFRDIKEMSSKLWDQLTSQEDRKFYIVLTGDSVYKKLGTPCTQKSNMFLAILALCYNVNLLDNFVDFVCRDTPLHDDVVSEDVTNYVYLDDASFSGTQMSTSITCMGGTLERLFPGKERFRMHLVVLYLSRYARENTPTHNFPGDTHWYTTETRPIMLEEALLSLRYQESRGSRIDRDTINAAARAFTRESPGVYDEMDKPLFYTDLKIPDRVSVYPKFLLSPVLVDSEFRTVPFDAPIVNNCSMPVDGEEARSTGDFYRIDSGTFCPVPTYKEPDWKERVQDLFPLFC
jgi:hypothetical protein